MKQNLTLFKSVVSNYNVFCSIAENIEWIKIKETHKDWFKIYPLGIFVNDYEFPKGYIQNNIVSAYVRTVLCDIAFSEKWDKDFWNIQKKERKRYLTEGILLYKSYAILKEEYLSLKALLNVIGVNLIDIDVMKEETWR